ncbi:MAG: chromate transporter [Gammaproteobacteria bacterium]
MTEATQPPKDLYAFLDFYLVQKAPFQIPDEAKEWIVKYSPWISVVLLVITLPALLLALGLGAALVPFGVIVPGFAYVWVLLLAHVVLLVMALPGLFARKMSSWKLVFYARIVSIVSSLLSGAIVSAVVGGLISLYVLFQIRDKFRP